jgi:hypothetical protein
MFTMLATVRSATENAWLECGVVDDAMSYHKNCGLSSNSALISLS